MNRLLQLLAFALVLSVVVAPALPARASSKSRATVEESGSARLAKLLSAMKAEQEKVHTLTADFKEEKISQLLAKPAVSHGRFSYEAPDKVRWEYEKPTPITLVIQGDEMTTWFRDLGRADKVKVSRYSRRVLQYMGAGVSVNRLLSYFEVALWQPGGTDQDYRLDLIPRYDRLRKHLKTMTVWIDSRTYLMTRLRYEEPDGDRTEYDLSHLVVNQPLPADRFVVKLPPGVQVRQVDLDASPGAL